MRLTFGDRMKLKEIKIIDFFSREGYKCNIELITISLI